MRIIGVIPARGGSKGVVNKNIRIVAGRPLISYMIETALSAGSQEKCHQQIAITYALAVNAIYERKFKEALKEVLKMR